MVWTLANSDSIIALYVNDCYNKVTYYNEHISSNSQVQFYSGNKIIGPPSDQSQPLKLEWQAKDQLLVIIWRPLVKTPGVVKVAEDSRVQEILIIFLGKVKIG